MPDLNTRMETPVSSTDELLAPEPVPENLTGVSSAQLLVWALLATAGMLFVGFASAYLVRRAGTDWERLPLPRILWYNSLALLASSATIETARTANRAAQFERAATWVAASTFLGLFFLCGQLLAWRQLAMEGVYLPTNPYSSFFYTLTAVHGAHLLGGIIALIYTLASMHRSRGGATLSQSLDGCATYWHFLDATWFFLYLLLLVY